MSERRQDLFTLFKNTAKLAPNEVCVPGRGGAGRTARRGAARGGAARAEPPGWWFGAGVHETGEGSRWIIFQVLSGLRV